MKAARSWLIAVLLEIGTVSYLVGAAAWALFWLGWLPLIFGNHRSWAYLAAEHIRYWGFPSSAVSLILVGLSCFALGKLYRRMLAVVTGITYIISAVPFFLMNDLLIGPRAPFYSRYTLLWGFGLLMLSLILWSWTVLDILRLPHHNRLAAAIGVMSTTAAFIFFLLLPLALRWGVWGLTALSQPYVLAQILSAVLLHKISSNTQQKL